MNEPTEGRYFWRFYSWSTEPELVERSYSGCWRELEDISEYEGNPWESWETFSAYGGEFTLIPILEPERPEFYDDYTNN